MATEYTDRVFIFVTAAKVTQANTAAKNWDPDTAGEKTFTARGLSATGALPATHWGCDTRLTAAMKVRIDALKAAQGAAVALYYESAGWTWASALSNAGLVPANPSASVP